MERRGKRISICQRKGRGISSPKRSVSDETIESLDLRVKEEKEMNCSLGGGPVARYDFSMRRR
jgi:hypothetical protein